MQTDPLSLKNLIFSDKCQKLLATKYDNFVSNYFYDYLLNTLIGEYEATIAYPILLSKFKNGEYLKSTNHLSAEDKLDIEKYFQKMIADENLHSDFLKNIFLTVYQASLTETDIKEIHNVLHSKLATEDFVDTLCRYYVGECYLWVSFYKIFRDTRNSEFKKIFHKLLVDESHHNNSIYKILNKIKNNVTFNKIHYCKMVSAQKYFGLSFVRASLHLPGTNTKQDLWWEDLIYNCSWQQHFHELFLKKCFQIVPLFDSTIEYQQFKTNIANL